MCKHMNYELTFHFLLVERALNERRQSWKYVNYLCLSFLVLVEKVDHLEAVGRGRFMRFGRLETRVRQF